MSLLDVILCPLAKNLPNSFKMHGIHNSNMYYNENQNVYLIMYPHQEYMQVHQPHSPHYMDSTWRQGKGEPNKLQCQFVKRVHCSLSLIDLSFIKIVILYFTLMTSLGKSSTLLMI